MKMQKSDTSRLGEKISRKRVRFGIKWKLLCTLIPTVICIVAVILVIIHNNTSKILLNKSESILMTSVESVQNSVRAWMNETITALNVERDAISYFSMEEEEQLAYIKHTADQYESFPAGIYLATTKGELIHSSFVPGPEYDVFEKPWYKDGIESEDFIFGSVYYDEDSKAYVVGASGVWKDNKGKVRGVAAADIYLDAISRIVEQVSLEETGGMFLVDRNTNMIIGHKEADLIGTVLTDQSNQMYPYVNDQISAGAGGVMTYTDPEKGSIYLDIEQVEGSSFITVAYVPEAEIMQDLNQLTARIALIAAVGILLLIVFMERLIHLVVRPVKKINGNISDMTGGDFTTEVKVKSKDEIGSMAEGLRGFLQVMKRIMGNIGTTAVNLNRQSESSAEVAQQLSRASMQQSESMGEMEKTINELTISISEVASNATSLSRLVSDAAEHGEKANEYIANAVQISDTGRGDMERVALSMQEITDKMEQLEHSAENMDESVSKINSIVGLIGDIAEETNLLSLNASIEAARAGEAGRGFAVVADQIGKLASTSKTSVDEIIRLTTEISELVKETVAETKDNSRAIGSSNGLVVETREKFQVIFDTISMTSQAVTNMVSEVAQVNGIATSVAGITQEQSAASQEILATTESIKENADIVSEHSTVVAEESDKLLESAKQLRESVENFKW